MNTLLSICLLAGFPVVPLEVRYPEAHEVFHCTFDESWDENYDHWPDRWTRRRGRGYPHYLNIAISDEPSPVGNRCLRIDLDGGGAGVYSPAIEVSPLYCFVLEGWVKTEKLKHDRAWISLTLLDADQRSLESYRSPRVRVTDGWKKFRIGPVEPQHNGVCLAVVGLHLEPTSRADLRGAALFDDLWVGRLPRMSLSTGSPHNVYFSDEGIEVACEASGYSGDHPMVEFELEGPLGKNMARTTQRLAGEESAEQPLITLDGLAEGPVARKGSTQWKPPLDGPGFYRVRATIRGEEMLEHRRELALAVIDPGEVAARGEFGWSLPDGDEPLPLHELGKITGHVGINWVKFPLWYGAAADEERIEKLILFAERLNGQGIEIVGMLNNPPEEISQVFGGSGALRAADLFTPPADVWYPSIEPVMMRLATRVRWWQLGADRDQSFVGYLRLPEKLAEVKAKLDLIGQDTRLGIGWGWLNAMPEVRAYQGEKPSLRFLALSADPPLTHEELAAYLQGMPEFTPYRWVSIEPLPRNGYALATRAEDLAQRMMTAKIHKAEAIFNPNPFDAETGLMNADGTAGDLLLPWRTMAMALSGTEYLGSVQLPRRSKNHVFAGNDKTVMIVWNDSPVQETLYLGEKVVQCDLWGKRSTPATDGHRQVIDVGPIPTILTGVNESICRWRMGFRLARDRLPSIFGREHANSFQLKNAFPRGVAGRVELIAPDVWQVSPKEQSFRLASGEQREYPLNFKFPYNASSGRHEIRLDFEVQADRIYRFSAFRRMDVGMGDVYITVATQLNDQGELEVYQRFVNDTQKRVSFRCQLFAPGRRRLKSQIIGQGQGRDVQVYRLENGEELVGQTLWLRAEEMNGPRLLNYRFVAQ